MCTYWTPGLCVSMIYSKQLNSKQELRYVRVSFDVRMQLRWQGSVGILMRKDSNAFNYLIWIKKIVFMTIAMNWSPLSTQSTRTHRHRWDGIWECCMNYSNWIIKHLSICCVSKIVFINCSLQRWPNNLHWFFSHGELHRALEPRKMGKFEQQQQQQNEKFKQNVLSLPLFVFTQIECISISKYFPWTILLIFSNCFPRAQLVCFAWYVGLFNVHGSIFVCVHFWQFSKRRTCILDIFISSICLTR